MNLMDAIKTGKRFRNKSWGPDYWMTISDYLEIIGIPHDLTDDGWEVEPIKIELNLDQFTEAWVNSVDGLDLTTASYNDLNDLYLRVVRSLGFLK